MRLDLKELVAKVTGQAEFKKLLWTNPNTQSAFSAQYVYLDLSNYDAVEIEVNMYTSSTGEYHQTFYGRVGTNLLMSGMIYQTTMPLSRLCEIRNSSILFNEGFANTINNQAVIPIRIYGIKYLGGVLLNSILKAYRRFASSKGGGVNETEIERTSRQNACALYCDILQRCVVVRESAYLSRFHLCKQYGSINYTISCRHIFKSNLCNSVLWSRRLWCIRHYQHNEFIDHINNTVPIQFSRCRNGGFCSRNRTGITPERGCAVC